MKKRYILAIVLSAMFLSFTVSCSKSEESTPTNPETPDNPINHGDLMGVYNPGKKIKKVYKSSTYQEKYLSEVWNWDGDLLESISHYDSEGNLLYSEQCIYENNRIIRVETYSNPAAVTTYGYEGNNLKIAQYYYTNGGPSGSYTFAYQNSKINEIIYEGDPKKSTMEKLETTTMVFQFTWSGENVTSLLLKDSDGNELSKQSFLYDEKNNPKRGFLNSGIFLGVADDYHFYFSMNNVTRADYMDLDSNRFTIYDYQYDDDGYPIKITEKMYGGSDDEVTYFEYE